MNSFDLTMSTHNKSLFNSIAYQVKLIMKDLLCGILFITVEPFVSINLFILKQKTQYSGYLGNIKDGSLTHTSIFLCYSSLDMTQGLFQKSYH